VSVNLSKYHVEAYLKVIDSKPKFTMWSSFELSRGVNKIISSKRSINAHQISRLSNMQKEYIVFRGRDTNGVRRYVFVKRNRRGLRK